MTSHIEEPPLRDKLTLTVPEAGALSGIPARVVRAAVLNGDMPACYAGSTTCASAAPIWTSGWRTCRLTRRLRSDAGDRRYAKRTDPVTIGPVLYKD